MGDIFIMLRRTPTSLRSRLGRLLRPQHYRSREENPRAGQKTWDSKEGRFFTAQNALRARLVDGRDADLVTLGKIAQGIVPAVRKFAEENQGLLLEAARRGIHNELATLEREIESKRAKLEER